MRIETHSEIFDNDTRDWHTHDRDQLLYAYSGVMRIAVDDGEWVLPPERGVWIARDCAHRFVAAKRIEFRTVFFDGLPETRATGVFHVSPLLRQLIDFVASEPDHPARMQAAALIPLLVRTAPAASLIAESLSDRRLIRLRRLVVSDFSDTRTLPELAREIGAGARTISRLFQTETGTSFERWRRNLKMHKALELLGEGESVTEVGFALGYASTSGFIHAFREIFGTTPNRYFTRQMAI